ncbi:MAG: YwaF family protein [Treponema sp.]|nr:YwaF family protein [Treponema sp.]
MVKYFNFYYFLYIAIAFGLLFGFYFILRNRSKKTASIVLFIILLSSFILHFLKLHFEPYRSWMPNAIRTVTPENLCAVSVLIFPWLFISKNNILKDYMFFMGVISGFAATIIPIDVIDFNAFSFETFRFYYCHIIIWVVPLLMVLLKLHTIDYKRIIKVPFISYLVLLIILLNEVILIGLDFVPISFLFSNEIRNSSLIFGPLPDVKFLSDLFLALTPKIFTIIPFGVKAGQVFYWPIIWLVIPYYVYFCITAFLFSLPFEFANVKKDIIYFIDAKRQWLSSRFQD